jgi:hypothetical protein
LSSAEVFSFTTPDLLRLIYAALILGKLSSYPHGPLLERGVPHIKAGLGRYLNALVDKLRNMLTELHNPPDHYLVFLCRMFEDSRKWYTSTAAAAAARKDLFFPGPIQVIDTPSDTDTGCCVDLPDGLDNCPDLSSVWDREDGIAASADEFINWDDIPS